MKYYVATSEFIDYRIKLPTGLMTMMTKYFKSIRGNQTNSASNRITIIMD